MLDFSEDRNGNIESSGPEEQSVMDWGWSGGVDDILADEGDHLRDILPHSLPDREGCYRDFVSVEDLDDQEDVSLSSAVLAQSFVSALEDISDTRKGRKKKVVNAKLKTVSEEDYDHPIMRKLVILLKHRVESILNGDSEASANLRWFFVPTLETDINFESSVAFLGAEPQAVRLKLQAYLYKRWVVLNEPISPFANLPPEDIYTKSGYYAGDLGQQISADIWRWPSITIKQLLYNYEKKGKNKNVAYVSLEKLLASKIILEHGENLYVVGHYGQLIKEKGF